MKVLDLFSGIGGFSLGLERAGMETVAFCEIDPFCRKVLAKHWPHVPIYEDITKLKGDEVGPIDVICGGFPCQDISYAGRRAGITGARSRLFWELVRTVRLARPKFVIVENVAALSTGGLGTVLGAMAVERYDAEWDCISAAELGAYHGRPRCFLAFTDTDREQRENRSDKALRRGERGTEENSPPNAPNTNGERELQLPWLFGNVRRRIDNGNARAFWACDWQAKFEALRRMDNGIPSRLDKNSDGKSIGSLGNAVLPQKTEAIGRAIIAQSPVAVTL